MRKVLQVVDSFDPGGAERHVVDLSRELARRGNRVHVASSAGGALAHELDRAGIWWIPLMPELVKRRSCVEFGERLSRLVLVGNYDVVHAHMYASAAAATVIDHGAAVVVTEHTEAPWRTTEDRLTSSRIYRRAALVLAVSTPIVDMLRTEYGLSADQVVLVPPAITPERVPAAARPTRWQNRPVVGRVCRLQPEKGVEDFLRAAALVRRQVPHAMFLVVGDGPLAGWLPALAADLGLDDHVLFTGHRRDARAIIGMLDVLAVSSRSDGTPLVVFEALSAGVPVVASAVGGIPEQIRDGREGLLVPATHPESLAEGIVRLLTDPVLANRLRHGALRRAKAFPFDGMVDAIEAGYTRALRAAAPESGAARTGT